MVRWSCAIGFDKPKLDHLIRLAGRPTRGRQAVRHHHLYQSKDLQAGRSIQMGIGRLIKFWISINMYRCWQLNTIIFMHINKVKVSEALRPQKTTAQKTRPIWKKHKVFPFCLLFFLCVFSWFRVFSWRFSCFFFFFSVVLFLLKYLLKVY